MSAKFAVVIRSKPNDPTAPKTYHPILRSTDRLTIRQLAARIAQMSTVSPADTLAVLESLLSLVPQELSDGKIVELGDLGTFALRIRTEGAATPEEVTSHNIKDVSVSFRPSKYLKQQLGTTEFQKIST